MKYSLHTDKHTFLKLLVCVLAFFAVISPKDALAIKQGNNAWSSEVKQEKLHAFRIKDLTGVPGKQLKIDISVPSFDLHKTSSMTFYGMPDSILLSSGVRRAKVWIVPVNQVKSLSLIAPAGYKGLFEAAAILRRADGQVIEGQRFVVNISKSNKTKKVAKLNKDVVELKPKESIKQEDEMSPSQKAFRALALGEHKKANDELKKESLISPVLEKKLVSKAYTLLDNGNIIAARETFKFLASQGHAESAYIIAKTYDPEEFANFDARGILPNLKLAKEWYTKAAQLGSDGAKARLKEYANAGL